MIESDLTVTGTACHMAGSQAKVLLEIEQNQVTATSSATTTHAHAGVVPATNDNCVIKIFQISTQAVDDRTCRNDVNDFFHFLTGLYFPLLADQDLAPFSGWILEIGCQRFLEPVSPRFFINRLSGRAYSTLMSQTYGLKPLFPNYA